MIICIHQKGRRRGSEGQQKRSRAIESIHDLGSHDSLKADFWSSALRPYFLVPLGRVFFQHYCEFSLPWLGGVDWGVSPLDGGVSPA